jgi:hypothetical protein
VWCSEFTSKDATQQGGPAETAAGLNAELWFLVVVVVVVVVVSYPFSGTAKLTPLFESIWTFENNFESPKEPFSGILTRELGPSEMVPFLRGAMRVIASLGYEEEMRALASRMSPHVNNTALQVMNSRRHAPLPESSRRVYNIRKCMF